eukprot:m.228492 g.228492  ORF g.228492 m.228492 type:complete len:444 (+) comp15190_c1_seq16:730-2061(+)
MSVFGMVAQVRSQTKAFREQAEQQRPKLGADVDVDEPVSQAQRIGPATDAFQFVSTDWFVEDGDYESSDDEDEAERIAVSRALQRDVVPDTATRRQSSQFSRRSSLISTCQDQENGEDAPVDPETLWWSSTELADIMADLKAEMLAAPNFRVTKSKNPLWSYVLESTLSARDLLQTEKNKFAALAVQSSTSKTQASFLTPAAKASAAPATSRRRVTFSPYTDQVQEFLFNSAPCCVRSTAEACASSDPSAAWATLPSSVHKQSILLLREGQLLEADEDGTRQDSSVGKCNNDRGEHEVDLSASVGAASAEPVTRNQPLPALFVLPSGYQCSATASRRHMLQQKEPPAQLRSSAGVDSASSDSDTDSSETIEELMAMQALTEDSVPCFNVLAMASSRLRRATCAGDSGVSLAEKQRPLSRRDSSEALVQQAVQPHSPQCGALST